VKIEYLKSNKQYLFIKSFISLLITFDDDIPQNMEQDIT